VPKLKKEERDRDSESFSGEMKKRVGGLFSCWSYSFVTVNQRTGLEKNINII